MDMWKIRATKLSQDLAKKQVSINNPNLKDLEEELDDLRYNYKESVRLNLLYEQKFGVLAV